MAMDMAERDLIPFKCVIMRCGTSKGIFMHRNHLPQDEGLRDRAILAIFGSPDRRQIDGLGGAEPLTSKLALIGPPTRGDADVDYTFGQVEIEGAFIHYSGLCGNISSGVGAFAIEEGLVRAAEPVTKVRVHSTNTAQVYTVEVPVKDGLPRAAGDYRIDGVPGAGAKLTIDMAGTVASRRRGLFPTGRKKDEIWLPGHGAVTASVVDVVNPCAFVRASDLGLRGDEATKDVSPETFKLIERVRAKVAELIGIEGWGEKAFKDPNPFLAFVSEPRDYENALTGGTVCGDDVDFLSRAYFLGGIHQTYPGSVSCATGACSKLPGTVAYEVSRNAIDGVARIGHPAGVIEVEAVAGKAGDGLDAITRVTYGRTARRIMDGTVYVPRDVLKGGGAAMPV
jgi:2-methylaconitate cis-trans-isomerase PrpF